MMRSYRQFLAVMLLVALIGHASRARGGNDAAKEVAQTFSTLSDRDIATETPPEIAALIKETFSPDMATRIRAAEQLGQFGTRAIPAIPFLIRLLGDAKETTPPDLSPHAAAYHALRDLGEMGAPTVQPLIAALAHQNQRGKILIVRLLWYRADARAIPALLSILNDPDVRTAAVEKLKDTPDVRAVEPLIGLLRDPDKDVARAAAEGLGAIRDQRAVEPLLAVLEDRQVSDDVRGFAAFALGTIRDQRAVEPLMAVLEDRQVSDDVRRFAAKALGEMRDQRGVKPLLAALADRGNPDSVRGSVAEALGAMGDPRVSPSLLAVAKDDAENDVVCGPTLAAIGLLRDPGAFDVLRAALDSDSESIRCRAVEGLAHLDDPRCRPLLVGLLRSRKELSGFQGYVAELLVETGDAAAIDAVNAAFDEAGDLFDAEFGNLADKRDKFGLREFTVRREIVEVLAMSPKPRAYLRAMAALQDKDPDIRNAVTYVLATNLSYKVDTNGEPLSIDETKKLPALDDPRVLQALIVVAENPKELKETREYARDALRKSGAPEAVEFLNKSAADASQNVAAPKQDD